MAFTALQDRANTAVEAGDLETAMPYLKEIIKRVDGAEDNDYGLAFPLFLIGTSHIQRYVNTGNKSELKEALKWYDRLEKDYPNASQLKPALMKRIDVLRALGDIDGAIKLMQKLLSDGYPALQLSYKERIKLLKDLTQIYYGLGKLKEGIPYFNMLMDTARDLENKVLGAAAKFEALMEAKRYDDSLQLLPLLAKEAEVRYRPRLNVALLKASDIMVEQNRYNDAALLLNLIKTTDIMIEYHENQISAKQAQLEQRLAIGGMQESADRLKQEIKSYENNLVSLRKLPTLRNELLVRRARNYTKTERSYEAFWMFYDLQNENPDDKKQGEFYSYAAFSNARKVSKFATMLSIGEDYRAKYPNGKYFSDISAAMAKQYLDEKRIDAFEGIVIDFLNTHPTDPYSSNLLSLWATHWFSEENYAPVVTQTDKWLSLHDNPIFEDGLYYWGGLARLQLQDFAGAVTSFDGLLTEYPTSLYAEDGLLRKGVAQFYLQDFAPARETLTLYTTSYPQGALLDQAFYFLGEVESMEGYLELALSYFRKADELTTTQDMHDGCAFRIGNILEMLGQYDAMLTHFQEYVGTYEERGRLTDAIYELGRALEFLRRPVEMLALYRGTIIDYADLENNPGVDSLIEGYAEKYAYNQKVLARTVEFLDQLRDDLEFRTKIVTDRGFLFEQFYNDPSLDQTLYNRMRSHPAFGPALAEDLSPIEEVINPFRQNNAKFPAETPDELFSQLLAEYGARGSRIAEVRMLMGLYRMGIERTPAKPFTTADLKALTPRLLLYVADYSRTRDLDFAIETWNEVLTRYAQDDAAIVALLRLADVSAQRDDKLGAINYLDQIIDQFAGSPQIPAVILRKGELLTEMGETEAARAAYQYILRVPDWRGELQARALLQTAEAFMADGAFPEAHGFFERTFLAYSHLGDLAAKAYLGDADALVKMGAKQDAITTLTEASTTLEEVASAELYESITAKLKEIQ